MELHKGKESEIEAKEPGSFKVPFKVYSFDKRKALAYDGWVDTGTPYTVIPEDDAASLGLEYKRTIIVKTLAGKVPRRVYQGLIEIKGRTAWTQITGAPTKRIKETGAVIGSLALEALHFKPNPLTRQLEDAGEIVALGPEVEEGEPLSEGGEAMEQNPVKLKKVKSCGFISSVYMME